MSSRVGICEGAGCRALCCFFVNWDSVRRVALGRGPAAPDYTRAPPVRYAAAKGGPRMAENKTITLCADDYGLSHGVSVGILEALRAGRLSAVSALTNGARWPALGRDLLRENFDADVGLHFNLTLGAPLAAMPIFAPDGVFPPVSRVIKLAARKKLPMDEIRAEIERQLDRFEAVMELPPDFVDGHQHVQALPGVRGALLDALKHRRLQGKCWLRDSGDGYTAFFYAARRSKKGAGGPGARRGLWPRRAPRRLRRQRRLRRLFRLQPRP